MGRRSGSGGWLKAILLLVLGMTSLSSCGGGGNGSSSGNLVFTANTKSISFDYQEGQPPPSQTITITATGQFTGTLYVAAILSGPQIDPDIPITVTGTTATVQISVAPQLAPGTYTGTLTLMACSDSACTHQVGNSPLAISFTITEHAVFQVTPSTVSLTAVTGTTASQLVMVQVAEGQTSFSAAVTSSTTPWLTISNTTASSFTLAAGALAPGTYSGQVTVTSGGASADVAVTYVVTSQPLVVTPPSVSFSEVSGNPASQTITVQLPTGQTSASASVGSISPWLTITNATAASFTLSAASLPSGSYYGQVQVTSGTHSALIVVNYTVSAPAGGDQQMAVSPASLTLSTVEDATTSAMLTVTPPSWNPQVAITAEYPSGAPSGWLTLSQVTGGESVVASAAALTAGSYTANIRVHGAYPATDILVPVALTVGVGLVRPADVPITISAETTTAVLSGSVPVTVAGGPPVPFSAASNVPWLILTTSSGQTGQSLSYHVDPTQIPVPTGGQVSTAQVTITPAVSTMTPVSFNVQVTGNLPTVQTLAPYVQLAGQPARVILRGSGFSAIASLAARLAIDGQAPTSVSLVADTEVVAQFAALAVGNHTVTVSNALGVATGTGRVLATTVPAYSYAVIPIGGSLRSLAYDPERDALYGANVTAESIMSLRHTAASATSEESWTTSSVPLASAFDVGLTQDGTALIANSSAITGASATGSIQVMDPASLAVRQAVTLTNGFLPSFATLGFGIPTTNDGRSWLSPTLPGLLGQMAYITPQSLTPTAISIPSIDTSFDDGPWYAMSRDGERLLIVQTNAETPQPMLYMNAADSVITINPAGLTSSTHFSLSDTGDRVLFDSLTVRDSGFNLIGPATLPSSTPAYFAYDGLVTPDGTRVYVLAYRSDAGVTAGVTPRVFVFDSTTPATSLPLLGYFDVPDYPGCIPNTTTCAGPSLAQAVSLDGQTLFFEGTQNLLVVPVPTTLSTAVSTQVSARAKSQRTPAVPWPVNVH